MEAKTSCDKTSKLTSIKQNHVDHLFNVPLRVYIVLCTCLWHVSIP